MQTESSRKIFSTREPMHVNLVIPKEGQKCNYEDGILLLLMKNDLVTYIEQAG